MELLHSPNMNTQTELQQFGEDQCEIPHDFPDRDVPFNLNTHQLTVSLLVNNL